jgi:GrpB-like predicted nucleotidyltransferase (UPF0157 family)
MLPRLGDFRTVLDRNGFSRERKAKHEIWIRRDDDGQVTHRVPVSHGNDQIRTERLFADMLRQSGKTRQHFNDVLRGG